MYENEVSSAFEILLEEIETIIDKLNQEGAKQFSRSSHKEARQLLDKVESANRFRTKIKELQKEWHSLESLITKKSPSELQRNRRRRGQRLQRGLRTPEDEFRIPILEALVRLGGKARADDVLKQVGKRMTAVLNEYDKQRLPSTPGFPRWRNTAQWTRNALVNEGLLSKNSPRAIWEITLAGREALEETPENDELAGAWPSQNEGPKSLYYVLRVYKMVESGKFSYNEAVAQITKEQRLKSIHTVYDACTRRIGLNTEQFRSLLGDPQLLVDHLKTIFPEHELYIEGILTNTGSGNIN